MGNSGKTERTGAKNGTTKNRTKENKRKFIEKLREMPIIQVAAAQVGIHRDTYYEWRTSDRDFKEQCDASLTQGQEFVCDMAESMLVKSIKEGKMTAIIFWLKNHNRQYNDRRYYEHKHNFVENPLTEERKKQIAECALSWAEAETGDERDEDYENTLEWEVEEKKTQRDMPNEVTIRRSSPKQLAAAPTQSRKGSPKKLPRSTVAKKVQTKKLIDG